MKPQGTETEMTEENSKEERGVKYGTRLGTGQLAVPCSLDLGTRAPQLVEPVGRTLRSGVFDVVLAAWPRGVAGGSQRVS